MDRDLILIAGIMMTLAMFIILIIRIIFYCFIEAYEPTQIIVPGPTPNEFFNKKENG